MALDKYFTLLCMFSCFCCVMCDLNLSEGSPCVTNGFNGTCVEIYRCRAAALTYLYANAGLNPLQFKFPELPDICSVKNNVPIICCTECELLSEKDWYRDTIVAPFGLFEERGIQVARTKCYENFQRLPYTCRGNGNVQVELTWKEEKKCHKSNNAVALGVGGRDAQRWEFPHSALIGYGDSIESAQWRCGGSVISERFILTAAHCSSSRELGSISYAALGLLKRSDPVKYWKIHKIKRIIIHPEYKPPSKYHDIALLETETEINFGKDVLPACLDTHLIQNEYNVSAEASGWGRLGHRNALADTLQVVTLYKYEETECAELFKPHRHLRNGYDHEKQMCYGNHKEIVDTCEGDSGGPLQLDEFQCLYTIIGVTSFGRDCGILGAAGMYTRVSYYVPWIEGVVWPEETEAQRKKDSELLDKLLNNL